MRFAVRGLRAVRPRTPRTLRSRLLLATVALLAAVSLVIGLVSVLVMSHLLEARLDSQLTSAVQRSQRAQQNRSPDGVSLYPQRPGSAVNGQTANGQSLNGQTLPGPPGIGAPGQGQGTLVASIDTSGITSAAVLGADGSRLGLTTAQRALVRDVPVSSNPATYDLGGRFGEYRMLAQRLGDGTVLLTGLPLEPVRTAVMQLVLVVTVVSLIGLLAAAAIGAWIVRFTLRPLSRVAATATSVAELPLDRGEVALGVRVAETDTDPRTEVGQVGSALNRMLEHITRALESRQASEARVRRFVADASHELRTPLAAIRGYAELTRRSRDVVPPDIAHALSRVESESIRMTGLVDDLLLLARLDDGRPLERDPVDLTQLVLDTVSDAHAAGPEHRWRLDVPSEPVLVEGDEARLHQVLANLLANARVHTPAGTSVTVSLQPVDDAGLVRLSVLDDGPGIPESLQPEVFERFARGDSSRSRGTGSTGLGLSIVAAVVAAHGGGIEVDSRPGHTEFRVTMAGLKVDVAETVGSSL